MVFGIAILHHLDLQLVAREVHRILKPGGRAIFQEPVRNSVVLRFIRRLIPYRAPDISPYERPLTDAELEQFGRAFSRMHVKAFTLPFVSAAMLVPRIRRDPGWWYRLDARLLEQCPYLHHYASIRVIELQKCDVQGIESDPAPFAAVNRNLFSTYLIGLCMSLRDDACFSTERARSGANGTAPEPTGASKPTQHQARYSRCTSAVRADER